MKVTTSIVSAAARLVIVAAAGPPCKKDGNQPKLRTFQFSFGQTARFTPSGAKFGIFLGEWLCCLGVTAHAIGIEEMALLRIGNGIDDLDDAVVGQVPIDELGGRNTLTISLG